MTKAHATFSDTIALVRRWLGRECQFSTSQTEADVVKIPRALFDRFTDALCYAASMDKVELRAYPKSAEHDILGPAMA